MRQCETCRYAVNDNAELRCVKRKVQFCRCDGAMQTLSLDPAYCHLINADDNCPDYSPTWSIRIRNLLSRR